MKHYFNISPICVDRIKTCLKIFKLWVYYKLLTTDLLDHGLYPVHPCTCQNLEVALCLPVELGIRQNVQSYRYCPVFVPQYIDLLLQKLPPLLAQIL